MNICRRLLCRRTGDAIKGQTKRFSCSPIYSNNGGINGNDKSRPNAIMEIMDMLERGSNLSADGQPPNDTAHKRDIKSDYIILGSKSSRLNPKKRPRKPAVDISSFKLDDLESQRDKLLKHETQPLSDESVAESIESMRPLSDTVSKKRHQQLARDIAKAFSLTQLRSFLKMKEPELFAAQTKLSKRKTVDLILKYVWMLSVSNTVSETSDVLIEHSVSLSSREMFLVVSLNGRLPKSWISRGAKVGIAADEGKLIIRSTNETYEWIMASLAKAINDDLKTREFEIILNDNVDLNRVQTLSNTFLELRRIGNTNRYHVTAYAQEMDSIDEAHRLLMFKPTERKFIYPTSPQKACLSKYLDSESLGWSDRNRSWKRLSLVKHRSSFMSASSIINATFGVVNENDDKSAQQLALLDNQQREIINIFKNYQNDQATSERAPTLYSATFGYLLHTGLPNSSSIPSKQDLEMSQKTFATNIPYLKQTCLNLPVFDSEYVGASTLDSEQVEATNEVDKKHEVELEWDRIFSDHSKDDTSEMVQIKFVPLEGNQNAPHVEAWFELDSHKKAQLSSIRLAKAIDEHTIVTATPEFNCDIQFSASHVEFLDPGEESVQKFLNEAVLNFSGQSEIKIPNLTIAGIQYMYQMTSIRRQVDLNYNGQILQLSSVEGGIFGGRRIEGCLVLEGNDNAEGSVETFVGDAYKFACSLGK